MSFSVDGPYPLTLEQIKAKYRRRVVEQTTSALKGLEYERQQIREEYERVSEIYARHLERLNKKMAKNVASYRNLQAHVASAIEKYEPRAAPPIDQPGTPA